MPEGIEVLSLKDTGFEAEIEENGRTLEENSLIKAQAVYAWLEANGRTGVDGVFADDTGLEINALNGAPGVFTARWAGEPAANRKKALRDLEGKDDRSCRFRTVITLIRRKEPDYIQVEGIVRGRIAEEEYGEGGFGYDPLFVPEGYDKTFGELPAELKNTISHRARALEKLVEVLKEKA